MTLLWGSWGLLQCVCFYCCGYSFDFLFVFVSNIFMSITITSLVLVFLPVCGFDFSTRWMRQFHEDLINMSLWIWWCSESTNRWEWVNVNILVEMYLCVCTEGSPPCFQLDSGCVKWNVFFCVCVVLAVHPVFNLTVDVWGEICFYVCAEGSPPCVQLVSGCCNIGFKSLPSFRTTNRLLMLTTAAAAAACSHFTIPELK